MLEKPWIRSGGIPELNNLSNLSLLYRIIRTIVEIIVAREPTKVIKNRGEKNLVRRSVTLKTRGRGSLGENWIFKKSQSSTKYRVSRDGNNETISISMQNECIGFNEPPNS